VWQQRGSSAAAAPSAAGHLNAARLKRRQPCLEGEGEDARQLGLAWAMARRRHGPPRAASQLEGATISWAPHRRPSRMNGAGPYLGSPSASDAGGARPGLAGWRRLGPMSSSAGRSRWAEDRGRGGSEPRGDPGLIGGEVREGGGGAVSGDDGARSTMADGGWRVAGDGRRSRGWTWAVLVPPQPPLPPPPPRGID
jgi:hypothetical protein